MNKIKKLTLTFCIVFSVDVFAFGHIDMSSIQAGAMKSTALFIANCANIPECKSEMFSPDWSEMIRAAKFVFGCWDLPCKNPSIDNFRKICKADSECTEMIQESVALSVSVAEECLLEPKCSRALKACQKSRKCKANWKACFSSSDRNNSSCKQVEKMFPDGFLENIMRNLSN